MTKEERARVGRLLRARRIERALDQHAIAKHAGLSVGTVQAIENNKYKVNVENIEKYAAVVETSIQALIHPAAPGADPRFADLNREHLEIARAYMRALTAQRRAVETILHAEAPDDLAEVVLALTRTSVPLIMHWTNFVLGRGDLLALIAQRLETDPAFEQLLRDQLASLDGYPVPPLTDAPPRRGRSRRPLPNAS